LPAVFILLRFKFYVFEQDSRFKASASETGQVKVLCDRLRATAASHFLYPTGNVVAQLTLRIVCP
jgi:hypothetical protein